MNTESEIRRASRLVDYTKRAASATDTVKLEPQFTLTNAARLHRHKQQQQQQHQKQHCKVPECIFLEEKDTPKYTRNNNVTFQLRRSLVDRYSFMSFLKGHFSKSDWDVDAGFNRSTLSLQQESDKDAPLTNDTSHTESSRTRRDTLIKKTLLKTQSMRQLNLDTSPLSIEAKTMKLPLRNRTFHGIKNHSLIHEPESGATILSNRSLHSLPRRTLSRRKRRVPRVDSSDASGSLRHRMGLPAGASKEGGYLPQCLHADTGVNPNRRTMMKKQTSFVTGSRIRTLRA